MQEEPHRRSTGASIFSALAFLGKVRRRPKHPRTETGTQPDEDQANEGREVHIPTSPSPDYNRNITERDHYNSRPGNYPSDTPRPPSPDRDALVRRPSRRQSGQLPIIPASISPRPHIPLPDHPRYVPQRMPTVRSTRTKVTLDSSSRRPSSLAVAGPDPARPPGAQEDQPSILDPATLLSPAHPANQSVSSLSTWCSQTSANSNFGRRRPRLFGRPLFPMIRKRSSHWKPTYTTAIQTHSRSTIFSPPTSRGRRQTRTSRNGSRIRMGPERNARKWGKAPVITVSTGVGGTPPNERADQESLAGDWEETPEVYDVPTYSQRAGPSTRRPLPAPAAGPQYLAVPTASRRVTVGESRRVRPDTTSERRRAALRPSHTIPQHDPQVYPHPPGYEASVRETSGDERNTLQADADWRVRRRKKERSRLNVSPPAVEEPAPTSRPSVAVPKSPEPSRRTGLLRRTSSLAVAGEGADRPRSVMVTVEYDDPGPRTRSSGRRNRVLSYPPLTHSGSDENGATEHRLHTKRSNVSTKTRIRTKVSLRDDYQSPSAAPEPTLAPPAQWPRKALSPVADLKHRASQLHQSPAGLDQAYSLAEALTRDVLNQNRRDSAAPVLTTTPQEWFPIPVADRQPRAVSANHAAPVRRASTRRMRSPSFSPPPPMETRPALPRAQDPRPEPLVPGVHLPVLAPLVSLPSLPSTVNLQQALEVPKTPAGPTPSPLGAPGATLQRKNSVAIIAATSDDEESDNPPARTADGPPFLSLRFLQKPILDSDGHPTDGEFGGLFENFLSNQERKLNRRKVPLFHVTSTAATQSPPRAPLHHLGRAPSPPPPRSSTQPAVPPSAPAHLFSRSDLQHDEASMLNLNQPVVEYGHRKELLATHPELVPEAHLDVIPEAIMTDTFNFTDSEPPPSPPRRSFAGGESTASSPLARPATYPGDSRWEDGERSEEEEEGEDGKYEEGDSDTSSLNHSMDGPSDMSQLFHGATREQAASHPRQSFSFMEASRAVEVMSLPMDSQYDRTDGYGPVTEGLGLTDISRALPSRLHHTLSYQRPSGAGHSPLQAPVAATPRSVSASPPTNQLQRRPSTSRKSLQPAGLKRRVSYQKYQDPHIQIVQEVDEIPVDHYSSGAEHSVTDSSSSCEAAVHNAESEDERNAREGRRGTPRRGHHPYPIRQRRAARTRAGEGRAIGARRANVTALQLGVPVGPQDENSEDWTSSMDSSLLGVNNPPLREGLVPRTTAYTTSAPQRRLSAKARGKMPATVELDPEARVSADEVDGEGRDENAGVDGRRPIPAYSPVNRSGPMAHDAQPPTFLRSSVSTTPTVKLWEKYARTIGPSHRTGETGADTVQDVSQRYPAPPGAPRLAVASTPHRGHHRFLDLANRHDDSDVTPGSTDDRPSSPITLPYMNHSPSLSDDVRRGLLTQLRAETEAAALRAQLAVPRTRLVTDESSHLGRTVDHLNFRMSMLEDQMHTKQTPTSFYEGRDEAGRLIGRPDESEYEEENGSHTGTVDRYGRYATGGPRRAPSTRTSSTRSRRFNADESQSPSVQIYLGPGFDNPDDEGYTDKPQFVTVSRPSSGTPTPPQQVTPPLPAAGVQRPVTRHPVPQIVTIAATPPESRESVVAPAVKPSARAPTPTPPAPTSTARAVVDTLKRRVSWLPGVTTTSPEGRPLSLPPPSEVATGTAAPRPSSVFLPPPSPTTPRTTSPVNLRFWCHVDDGTGPRGPGDRAAATAAVAAAAIEAKTETAPARSSGQPLPPTPHLLSLHQPDHRGLRAMSAIHDSVSELTSNSSLAESVVYPHPRPPSAVLPPSTTPSARPTSRRHDLETHVKIALLEAMALQGERDDRRKEESDERARRTIRQRARGSMPSQGPPRHVSTNPSIAPQNEVDPVPTVTAATPAQAPVPASLSSQPRPGVWQTLKNHRSFRLLPKLGATEPRAETLDQAAPSEPAGAEAPPGGVPSLPPTPQQSPQPMPTRLRSHTLTPSLCRPVSALDRAFLVHSSEGSVAGDSRIQIIKPASPPAAADPSPEVTVPPPMVGRSAVPRQAGRPRSSGAEPESRTQQLPPPPRKSSFNPAMAYPLSIMRTQAGEGSSGQQQPTGTGPGVHFNIPPSSNHRRSVRNDTPPEPAVHGRRRMSVATNFTPQPVSAANRSENPPGSPSLIYYDLQRVIPATGTKAGYNPDQTTARGPLQVINHHRGDFDSVRSRSASASHHQHQNPGRPQSHTRSDHHPGDEMVGARTEVTRHHPHHQSSSGRRRYSTAIPSKRNVHPANLRLPLFQIRQAQQ